MWIHAWKSGEEKLNNFVYVFKDERFDISITDTKIQSIFYFEEELESRDTCATWRETVALAASYVARRTR